jgi:hypothetical protein
MIRILGLAFPFLLLPKGGWEENPFNENKVSRDNTIKNTLQGPFI